MKTIGLVGGVASGKSLVAKLLADLGAGLLEADAAGHAVLADPDIQRQLQQRWGDNILDATGKVDRKAVAAKVFGESDSATSDRAFLESITHPRIAMRLQQEAASHAARGVPAVVLDAALLFEAGWEKFCDLVVFVDSPRPLRLARARSRGWTDEEFARREAAQWPVEEKHRQADYVLKNDRSIEELCQAVRLLWDQHIRPPADA